MTVVSNASPLINLSRIDKLEILHQLYGEIVLPSAVWNEIVNQGTGLPGSEEVNTANWIRVIRVENESLIKSLRRDLGDGEAEAIVLALELQSDLLLMDDRMCRETASYFGVKTVGVIGTLAEAKYKGLIEYKKTCLDQLHNQAGFFIKSTLYQRVLQDQGEWYEDESNGA